MISIIIPVLDEAETILTLLDYVSENSYSTNVSEMIVVDGGSEDTTKELVSRYSEGSNLNIQLIPSEKGRAKQMNAGARIAKGSILYFLHADSFPPKNFDDLILSEIRKGNVAGCFRMKFDTNHPLLKFSQWFTQFNVKFFRGGDQSLFISSEMFEKLDGFNEQYFVYEDCEFINRLYNQHHFTIIPHYILTSARKYDEIGTWKLQFHFMMIHLKNSFGASADKLHQYYRKHIV